MEKLLSLLLILGCLGLNAQGLKMTARVSVNAGGESMSSPMGLKVNSAYLRLNEYSFEGVEQESMIFNSENSDLIILSHATKEYILLTKDDMVAMMSRMAMAKENLLKQMESMSPEERAYMEQMLADQGISTENPPVQSFSATGKSETILGYKCGHYDGSADGVKNSEIWVCPHKSLGISEDDIRGLKAFSTYLKDIAAGFEAMSNDNEFEFLLHKDYDGIPLKDREYEGGKIVGEMQVIEIEVMDFNESEFSIPSNYQPISLTDGM